MSSDQMPRTGEDLVHQIPSLPGSKRRQMPGVCPGGGGGVQASIWLVHNYGILEVHGLYMYFPFDPFVLLRILERKRKFPLMYQSNRSFNIPPHGQPPGHLNFWKIFVQIPPSPGWKAVQMLPPAHAFGGGAGAYFTDSGW